MFLFCGALIAQGMPALQNGKAYHHRSQSDGWVRFTVKPLGNHSYYTTNPGRDASGKCKNEGASQGAWGTKPQAEQEVAINTKTCEIIWERGDPPHSP